MIVYGDPCFEATARALMDRLRARLLACNASSALDELRTLLILAGQVEQAIHDAIGNSIPDSTGASFIPSLHTLTAHAASAFYAAWARDNPTAPAPLHTVAAALNAMQEALAQQPAARDGPLEPGLLGPVTVKVPEGFAFYALYPEQYILAAQHWLADHAHEPLRCAAVVGIRSIGTTTAAVVATTLQAGGWRTRSFTVRPGGHPFARQVQIDSAQVGEATWGLIVDEGPGMSGSSMAAAAEALARAGLPRQHISLLPSHPGFPGNAASDEVRRWWHSAPRYVSSLSQLRFGGKPLPAALAVWTAQALSIDERNIEVIDCGGGLWRNVVYTANDHWPAVCAPFERPKYLCRAHARDGQALLWRFAGLASVSADLKPAYEREAERLQQQHDAPATLPYTGAAHGFVDTRWMDATPLTRADLDPQLLTSIGRHIQQTAGAPLSAAEQASAVARLSEMLYWNTWELLGEAQAEHVKAWVRPIIAALSQPSLQRYGDGHMAPHEWLRSAAGGIVKADSAGHDADHTTIGPQSVVWDIAAAAVEWGMDDAQASALLRGSASASDGHTAQDAFMYYRMAYAAFRAGQCALCAGMSTHDPGEQARLWQAQQRYREQLATLVNIVDA